MAIGRHSSNRDGQQLLARSGPAEYLDIALRSWKLWRTSWLSSRHRAQPILNFNILDPTHT